MPYIITLSITFQYMFIYKRPWLPISLIIFCFGITSNVSAQKYTISGYIRDASSGEELINATIYVKQLKTGAVTNGYGF